MQPTDRPHGGPIAPAQTAFPPGLLAGLRAAAHPYVRPRLTADVIADIDALWYEHHNREAVIAGTPPRWHYVAHLRVDVLSVRDCGTCRDTNAEFACPQDCPLLRMNRTPRSGA